MDRFYMYVGAYNDYIIDTNDVIHKPMRSFYGGLRCSSLGYVDQCAYYPLEPRHTPYTKSDLRFLLDYVNIDILQHKTKGKERSIIKALLEDLIEGEE